jgi:poly(A) polymerase
MKQRATRAVMRALGGEARFVGGCVRDTLSKRPIGDIDIATPLLPDEVTRRLTAARIKAIPTGIAHGTVTAVIGARHFEITTLRRDVETDGRHAQVAFGADYEADSRRRDFTFNALFLGLDGTVLDFQNGLRDLKSGKVRFIGDAATRIREDVLRLLRFYRFHARYGRGAADRHARAACRAAADLIPTLSGERVAAELLKLLEAPDPVATISLMEQDGVLAPIFAARAPAVLRRLIRLEPDSDPLRRLGALIAVDHEGVARRLKLSNAARERLVAMAEPIDLAADPKAQRVALYRWGRATFEDRVLVTAAVSGKTRTAKRLLMMAARWRPVAFPLKGRDVTALGVPPGPAVGEWLKTLEAWWLDGDFTASRRACLAALKRRIGGAGG